MVKALRSCLEAAKGKIKAGHLILRKAPREQLQDLLQPQIYPVYPFDMPDLQPAIPGILESWMSQETASYWQSPSSREKLSRSCLEAAKGKIKAGHLILRKSPKRTATGSSTASNISRIPIRHA